MRRLAWALILVSSVSTAICADQPKWEGTWAATVGTVGPTFAGTWTANPGEAAETVGGTWSLRDQNGTELASGTWAAGKEGKLWKGTWQARRASGQVYDGTWQAPGSLPATAHMPDLFEAALSKAMSGGWRMGNYSGAWTIRAYAPK